MGLKAGETRARLELIAKKISQGYTDGEIMDELRIRRTAFYAYKGKIFQIWGDLAAKKTEESLAFEADMLKDRLIRLQRILEMRIMENKQESLSEVAAAAATAAQIALGIFKLEFEGIKARQLASDQQKASRYLSVRDVPAGLSESDSSPQASAAESAAAVDDDPDAAGSAETDTKVY